ncbi:unnamed protein product [Rangifer tarandus platyrhynchus]|uniref:Uncharacterized protein n=1 Tax=Rangifer tarandus platyrhynchus TaxID=3082113 RepID=A0ABN8Z0F2_RANTA|nr:unnamed protein product [Rangifer tarandus platyrhynchus]
MKRVQKIWVVVVVVCGAVFLGLSSLRSEARNSGASASAQRSGHQLSAPPSAGSGPAAARAPCAVPSPGRTGRAWPKAQRYMNVPQGTPMSRGRRSCRRRRRGPRGHIAEVPRLSSHGSTPTAVAVRAAARGARQSGGSGRLRARPVTSLIRPWKSRPVAGSGKSLEGPVGGACRRVKITPL